MDNSEAKMSEDYVNFMHQKLKLSVALAVLRSKPEDLTVEEHLEDLRTKIQLPSTPDSDAMDVNSEDFDIYDSDATNVEDIERDMESPTILHEFNGNSNFESFTHTNFVEDINQQTSNVEPKPSNNNDKHNAITTNIINWNDNVMKNNDTDIVLNNTKPNEAKDIDTGDKIHELDNILKDPDDVSNDNLIDTQATNCSNDINFTADKNIQSTYNEILTQIHNFETTANNNTQYDKQYNVIDTQATILYSLNDFTQDCNYISQSQEVILNDIPEKYFLAAKSKRGIHTPTKVSKSVDIDNSNKIHKDKKFVNIDSFNDSNTEIKDNNNDRNTILNTNKDSKESSRRTEEQVNREAIPFKVVEEMNKIKHYLRSKSRSNCEGYTTDSGYRSDTQTKSSFGRSVKWSTTVLNQSAHCLCYHLHTCIVTQHTTEIVNEISQVLSDLIDSLHSDSQYPNFMEDILEIVSNYLKTICEGSCENSEAFINTEKYINKFLLFNKSYHIIRYSIDRITDVLDDLNKKLTQTDDLFEITNPDLVTNVCYVIHILEVLLQRYLSKKDDFNITNTQSSDTSRRTNISDIWKRKWDPDYKSKDIEVTSQNQRCVTSKVADVLNKVVVSCMDSYSLVSFAALQCFNVLQS